MQVGWAQIAIVGDTAGYRSITYWTCEQQVRQSTVQFTAQTHQWSYIYISLQHARPRRKEQNRIYFGRSSKSKVELALDVLKLLTDTKHRAASLRQQGYLLLFIVCIYDKLLSVIQRLLGNCSAIYRRPKHQRLLQLMDQNVECMPRGIVTALRAPPTI